MAKFSVSEMKGKGLMILYTAFLGALALSVLMMPVSSILKDLTRIPLAVTGSVFWLSLGGTVFSALVINRARKRCDAFCADDSDMNGLGLISFFKNKEAKIADISMFAAFAGVIVTLFLIKNVYAFFIFLGLLVFFFGMHCMLNGKNYAYIKFNQENKEL
ncbi:MAG: hypothetical protein E7619_04900 [Ruminococcaceae bacterium]|nr:hypothetical protein [Oscillospiraceae bacterium]